MSIKRVYKSTIGASQYLFRNGKSAHFVNGRYETDVAEEIAELDNEIQGNIPHIFIDPSEATRDTGLEDFLKERQIQATAAALKEYEARKADAPVVDLTKMSDEEALAAANPNVSDKEVVTEVDTGLAKLLAAKSNPATVVKTPAPAPSTGIATSNNAPKA